MITRLRRPDGTVHDIDHGPGPVGRAPGHVKSIGASPLTEAMGMVRLGLFPQTAAKKRYKREWEAKHK